MKVPILKKKIELHYRRNFGYAEGCRVCEHYVYPFKLMGSDGKTQQLQEGRCKVMGLKKAAQFRVSYDHVCDALETAWR